MRRTAAFPDTAAIRHFVSKTITRAHLADQVPEVEGHFETRSAHTVFVAAKK